jgi:hypothetical protein
MASRDLTKKFKSFRNEVATERIVKSDNKDYIIYFTKIDGILLDIKKLQKDAKKLFGSLQLAVFDSNDAEKKYKDKIHEIDTSIDSLRRMFDMKKSICIASSKQESIIIENMFKHKLSIFEGLIMDVQKGKLEYKKYMESLIPHDEIYDIFEAHSVRRQNQGQIIETSIDEHVCIEKEREIKEIVESINNLSQLVKDLSVMINSQSETLDRIDVIMDDTIKKVDEGIEELKKAEREQKKCVIQ